MASRTLNTPELTTEDVSSQAKRRAIIAGNPVLNARYRSYDAAKQAYVLNLKEFDDDSFLSLIKTLDPKLKGSDGLPSPTQTFENGYRETYIERHR